MKTARKAKEATIRIACRNYDGTSMGLVWKHRYLDEERAMFPEDPWTFGLRPNQHVLEKFLSYCERQESPSERWRPKGFSIRVRGMPERRTVTRRSARGESSAC